MSTGISQDVAHVCKNGHRWVAVMVWELGGWFYCDESEADCPICGCEDTAATAYEQAMTERTTDHGKNI